MAWHRTDAKPFSEPMTWTYSNKYVNRVHNVSERINKHLMYILIHRYILIFYTSISCPYRPPISNIHLWADDAHVFSGCRQIPAPTQAPLRLALYTGQWLRALWLLSCFRTVSRWCRMESNLSFLHSYCLLTHIGMESWLRWRKCNENNLFYCRINVCGNMQVTYDAGST